LLLGLALWPPAAPSDRSSTELFGFCVCQVELAHAFTRIGEDDAALAPLPSAISSPDMSDTRIVFFAAVAPTWGFE
jgi:hypothetical protein